VTPREPGPHGHAAAAPSLLERIKAALAA
jgi:hypothetical protein